MTLTVGSLFSGIGGLDLGLERAGMQVIWQSEIDAYASCVLAKHWPDVPNLGDVTTIDWSHVESPDVICGGYPCQPFSLAGPRTGDTDPRHLWPQFHRAIRLLRPRYALLENVPGHLSMGFDRVLGDLAEIGYDTEWCSIPAAAVGAPHLRWRLFAVAYARGVEHEGGSSPFGRTATTVLSAYPNREGESGGTINAIPRPRIMVSDAGGPRRRQDSRSTPGDESPNAGWTAQDDHLAGDDGPLRTLVDTDGERLERSESVRIGISEFEIGGDVRSSLADADDSRGDGWTGQLGTRRRGESANGDWWAVEPDVGRVAHGIPNRVDRLRCLGNAVVPQVAEYIGRMIIEAAA